MDNIKQERKPNRRNRGKRQGDSHQQQIPNPNEPQPSGSYTEPSHERGPSQHQQVPDERRETGRGRGQNLPRPSGPPAEHIPKDFTQSKQPPQTSLQQTTRFRGPPPQQVFQQGPKPGDQPTYRGLVPGQSPCRAPLSHPLFSLPGQQPPNRLQGTQFETPAVLPQPREPQKPAEKAWSQKSTTSYVPFQHPEPGAWVKKQQPVTKTWTSKGKQGDSQQLQAGDDPQPYMSQESECTPIEREIQDSQSGNVRLKTSEQPGSSKSSSKKSASSKKKQGIAEKPLHESLNKALVLGSSAEKSEVKSQETGLGQTSVQEPPKRQRILKHSAKYFESEKGHPVDVNYLRIDVKSIKFKIFQYNVDFTPKRPRHLYREALILFFKKNRIDRHPAFDGKTLLFAGGTTLRFENGLDSFYDTVSVTDGNEHVEFYITIRLARELNLQSLLEFMRNGSSMNRYNTQWLDVVLMNTPINCSSNLIKVGRSFYTRPARPIPLGGGLDLWNGHYQSVVIPWFDNSQENQHLYLNVDVAHKGFISERINVLEHVRREFFSRDRLGPNSYLIGWQMEKAENFLRNLNIEYQVPNQRKLSFRVASLGPGARNARFKPENQVEVTVEEYFRSSKNLRLQYSNLPCLCDRRGRLFPMEFCLIPSQAVNKQLEPNQSRVMVEQSALPTVDRKKEIMKSLANLDFAKDPCLEEFGLSLDKNFETVDAYVLKPPTIQYQKKSVPVRNGKWNNDQFLKPVNLSEWVLINTDSYAEKHLDELVKDFQAEGPTYGVNVSDPMVINLRRDTFDEKVFVDEFKKWKEKGATFFMVIMNTKINHIYNSIKRAAELAIYDVGVLTQCIKSETVTRQVPMNRFSMTAKNILLKLNAKISGVNHSLAAALRPEILGEDVMIVGADVTHPSPGSKELSIAAVAASHDQYGFQYNMQYRLQKRKVEVIVDLREIIIQQIEFYCKKIGKIPKRILYYRDGVGESYFKEVLDKELTAIKEACSRFNAPFQTTITFLVVQKRHHTRFFPSLQYSDGPRNQNVRAGTVVDEKITHPTEIEFFLVSHASLKGTAKPTKYRLLYDDSNPAIDQETLERLTYYLCHMFARCNRSVSYPAPTYYAHCAAFRAKAWWARQPYREDRLEKDQQERGQLRDDVVTTTPMFFI